MGDETRKAMQQRLAELYEKRSRLIALKKRLPGYRQELKERPSMRRLREIDYDIEMSGVLDGADPLTQAERRVAWRRFRRWVITALLLAVFFEFFGVPHIRTHYRYSGSGTRTHIHAARYWSFTGTRNASPEAVSNGCPLIALLPLEKSLRQRSRDGAAWVWNSVQNAWAEWRTL